MAVPVLTLNLAPPPSLWRQRHGTLSWIALGVGAAFLIGAIGFTWRAYHQAGRAGREAVSLTEEARRAAQREQQLMASLLEVDAAKEQPRWKLAERILQERSLPWSRLTAELEQCMVPDMRLKGIQRTQSNTQQVVMKLKGEARTRQAEAAFVEALRSAPVFAQVVLERESERAGGGWDFEISLPAAPVPPPFKLKPLKQHTPWAEPVRAATPPRPVPAPTRPIAAPKAASTSVPAPAPPRPQGPIPQPNPRPYSPPPPTHPTMPPPPPAGVQAQPPPEWEEREERRPRPRIGMRPDRSDRPPQNPNGDPNSNPNPDPRRPR